MKKHTREKNGDAIHIENRHPGCIWGGILHALNYNYHWRYVKKRLPLRRSGSPKHASSGSPKHASSGSPKHANGNGNCRNGKANQPDGPQNPTKLEGDNNTVNRKKTPFIPVTRSSIVSRLKSLVAEDKLRRKGQPQHRRSSTELPPTLPNPSSAPPTKTKDLEATDPAATHRAQQSTNDSSKKARSRRHTVDAVFSDSKEFVDALSLTNNESLLEKIVQKRDPSSPRRSLSSRPELQRCGTFPSPRLSDSKVPEDNDGRERCNDVVQDTFAPVVVPRIKVNDRATTKDMKDKFTRLDNKKEKQRIAMDGVLDKIPKDRDGISDETKREMFRKWAKKSLGRRKQANSLGHAKRERRYFKRTTSLDDSNMGRYCQLFESFNKETKHKDTNILKPEEQDIIPCLPDKRTLNRILSLPDFGTCSFRSEDSGQSSTDLSEFRIRPEVNLGLRFQSQLDSYIENESKAEPPIENKSTCEDAVSVDAIELTLEPSSADALDSSFEEPDQELESGRSDSENHESPKISKDQETDCFVRPIQVRPKDLDVFNYVRDILELSGFSGNETLGMWHADDQPVDPMVFEEVEFQCLPTSPKCYIGSENHLLCIFDLINEVLIEICQRSATYWPVPLTRHCDVHLMPFRHHVLEHVWDSMSPYLITIYDPTLDDFVRRDLERSDGWMNLQFESECVGLEVDDLMFEELVEDLIFDDLLVELIGA